MSSTTLDNNDREHLRRCVELASTALDDGDEPFGSLLVGPTGDVLFEDHNRVSDGDHTRHPEFEIARWAAAHLSPKNRAASVVYTSGEHCPMCAAAHAWVGLGRIVYASSSEQLSAWHKEWRLAPGPVAPLPINQVAPGIDVAGPDAELSQEIRALHARLHGVGGKISVVQGDITTQDVDAVVNAANNAMRGGGGVDGAIHRAGGPGILADCIQRFPHGLATGDAGWTTAGRLPAKWVIHTVGPNYSAGQRDRAVLESCYRRALEVADELGAKSVAFPLISAGVYGWPKQDAIDVALTTLSQTKTQTTQILVVAFDEATAKQLHSALTALDSSADPAE